MAPRNLRVLLTNDDGPPGVESPFVYGLYRHLTEHLGWNVKVVLPSSQKSWIGGAFQISGIINGRYYYPKDPDGKGETSSVSRPLKDGEVAEWILLDATPATCANIAAHNIHRGEVDLLISGPNLGRNSSSALALSSGTIGAALSSSMSKIRSIALSYGTVLYPTPPSLFEPAHTLGGRIVRHLWRNWGKDEGGLRDGEVDLYSINIPLVEGLLDDQGLKICWTRIWRNTYGGFFKTIIQPAADGGAATGSPSTYADPISTGKVPSSVSPNEVGPLAFKFSRDLHDLINPPLSSLPVGSDSWAFHKGWVSVTPFRASFAEPPDDSNFIEDVENRVWKMKL